MAGIWNLILRSGAVLVCAVGTAHAERINHEGRILGPLRTVVEPTLFNTPEADAAVSSMQIMPVDSAWNEDISRRPVLANSDAMIAQIMNDLSASRRTLRPFYEMNYVLVPDDQPRVPVTFFNYPDESDLDGGSFPTGSYPIPPNLPIETWPRGTPGLTLQQWQQDVQDAGGDRHAIIVAPGFGSIWETWLTRLTPDGWEASNGAKFDLGSNASRPTGWTSGDAAGLPMFPALVRYDECQRGMVEHALRLVVARTRREYIYPATHFASSTPASATNYPAMGQRLRLKAAFAIPDSWTIEEKAVARALKKYGALVADNGGFFSVSVCPDDRFAENAFDHLSTIGIENFEVIQTTGPTEGPRSPGAPAVNAGTDRLAEAPVTLSIVGETNETGGRSDVRWHLYSSPADVAFNPDDAATTEATFTQPGTYTVIFSADDGVHAVARDAVVVRVTSHAAPLNLSTRLDTGAGENVAIGGFIIAGQFPKKVLVRGIGHSLAASGVSGALADPVLELRDLPGAVVALNDNWRETQEQAIRETSIPPTDDLESAILVSLAPGAYTAILSGKNNSTGIGLVELYDLSPAPSSKFANISTRGMVGTSGAVMIGGFILQGPDVAKLLVRAIGPSLAGNGIAQPLADPQLSLFDAYGASIAMNDNWADTQRAMIQATGAEPKDALEAAVVADLAPGNYTAVVSGVGGGTGVALVEVYHLQ